MKNEGKIITIDDVTTFALTFPLLATVAIASMANISSPNMTLAGRLVTIGAVVAATATAGLGIANVCNLLPENKNKGR